MIVEELVSKWGIRTDQSKLRRFRGNLTSVRNGFLAITAFGAAAAAGIGYFAKKAGEMEQVALAFETMTGSAEKAQKLIKDITDFAAKTPFELTGLINSSKQLLAFGIDAEDIIEVMTNLGNVSAGIGRDKLPTLIRAFGKIRTKGRATMEELNMFLEAGVPILDALAKGYDVTTAKLFKMITAGKVGFKEVDMALRGMATGNGKFADLMKKQSTTFLGVVSNITDQFEQIAIQIGEALLPDLKELANTFLSIVEANKDLITQKFIDVIADIKFIVSVLGKIASVATIGHDINTAIATGIKGVVGMNDNKSIVNNVSVNVNGTGEPKRVAAEVKKRFEENVMTNMYGGSTY